MSGLPGRWASLDQRVELEVPALGSSLRVCRMVAAAAAASTLLGVDEVDDLRIAVDELCCHLLAGAHPGDRMRLVVGSGEAAVHVDGSLVVADDELALRGDGEVDQLSAQILDAMDASWSAGPRWFRFSTPREGM